MNKSQSEELNPVRNKQSQNSSSVSLKKINRVKSVHIIREKNWDNRFIYNKIPEYDSYKDKNVRINLSIKSYSGRKNLCGGPDAKNFLPNKLTNGDNSLNNNQMSSDPKNGRDLYKTYSTKFRDMTFNDYDNNLKYINMINLNNINKLWDELCVNKSYRNLFCVIYKELNDENKQEIYQKEINELISIKNDIHHIKTYIDIRQKTINELSELNDKLSKEINKNVNNSNQKENIIEEISKKIELLREHTINVCLAMKKLRYEINGIKHLDKYDMDLISDKFDFDKNYLIKMKGEINFLKDGYAKNYFNIEKDQTPFLLDSSENCLAKQNENNQLLHIVPINKEIKNDIIDCIYYIYQELIAYQNEKVSKNILKRISPMKRINNSIYILDKNNKFQITNGNGIEDNYNFKSNNSNLFLKKSFSVINTVKARNSFLQKNIFNLKDNYIYSKKKFVNINKNGSNNLLLNQIKSERETFDNKNNKNSSIGFKFRNPLIISNNILRKSEINKKENISNNDFIKNENKLNFLSQDTSKKNEDNSKLSISKSNTKSIVDKSEEVKK